MSADNRLRAAVEEAVKSLMAVPMTTALDRGRDLWLLDKLIDRYPGEARAMLDQVSAMDRDSS